MKNRPAGESVRFSAAFGVVKRRTRDSELGSHGHQSPVGCMLAISVVLRVIPSLGVLGVGFRTRRLAEHCWSSLGGDVLLVFGVVGRRRTSIS